MTPTSPADEAAVSSSRLTPAQKKRNKKIVSIYFHDRNDIALIRRVSKKLGMPLAAFVRQGAKLYAREVEKTGRARAA